MSDYYQQHQPPMQTVKPVKRLPLHRTFYWIGIISTIVLSTSFFVYSPLVDSVRATKQYRDKDYQDLRHLAIRELQRKGDKQSKDQIAFYEAQLMAQKNADVDKETYNAMIMRAGRWQDADAFAKAKGRSRENSWGDAVVSADREAFVRDADSQDSDST